MYIAIDIGGTKTLITVFTDSGSPKQSIKFPTPEKYDDWRKELRSTISSMKVEKFKGGAVAVPGKLDRKNGIAIKFGNRPWENLPLVSDVEHIVGCPFVAENDAKLGGLSESLLLKDRYSRVLYVTISTGIGIGLTVDGKIDSAIGDGGGRTMHFEHQGKVVPWETFGAGSSIVKTYGKFASEITDQATWRKIVRTFTPGFIELIAILNPEAIVIGGGAGAYLERFHSAFVKDLKKYESPMLVIPPILSAQRPDDAVAYGCFAYAKQCFGK